MSWEGRERSVFVVIKRRRAAVALEHAEAPIVGSCSRGALGGATEHHAASEHGRPPAVVRSDGRLGHIDEHACASGPLASGQLELLQLLRG